MSTALDPKPDEPTLPGSDQCKSHDLHTGAKVRDIQMKDDLEALEREQEELKLLPPKQRTPIAITVLKFGVAGAVVWGILELVNHFTGG